MKLDGIDAWLKHWLKLQKKKKRPLELKDPSHKIIRVSSYYYAVAQAEVEGVQGSVH